MGTPGEKIQSNPFEEDETVISIPTKKRSSLRRTSTHSESPVRYVNRNVPQQSTGWTKKKSLAMISDGRQNEVLNRKDSLENSGMNEEEERDKLRLRSDSEIKRKMTNSLDKTFQERLKQSSKNNSFVLFCMMGIQMFYLSVLLITHIFQNQNYTAGTIALIVSGLLAFLMVQVARFIEFKFKTALISFYLYIAIFLVHIFLSPTPYSPIVLILGFGMMTANCLQSSEIRLTNHLLVIFGLIVSAYLIKWGAIKNDCFGPGYCPAFQQPDLASQLFWIAMCVFSLFIVLYIDKEVHVNYQEFINAEVGVHTLVSANLDLQNQLRVAKIKPETDIAAPLTRATQLLVSFQEKNKNADNDGILHEIEHILSILNSDKLFEPEFFKDTGDSDVTNFLQDVLQTKKTFQLKSLSGPSKSVLKPNQKKKAQSDLMEFLNRITDPFVNIIELEVLSEGHALYYTAVTLFKEHNFQEILNIPERSFRQWILKMEMGYDRKNPYHNSSHAADVTQVMNYFISLPKMSELLTSEETLSCIVAAIGHDYMHPGFTNAFLIATRNPLALRYNDLSVLEHFHAASVSELFSQSDYGLFTRLSQEQKRYIREMIITMIMATDMSFHFEWLSKFKNKLSTNSFNFENLNDKKLILNIAMKCADINNLTRPLEISRIWTQLVIEEFFLQGDQEKARGLPVSMFMDRNNTDIPKCQIGFIDYIVLPLYEAWAEFLPSKLDEHIANLKSNKSFWKGKSEQGQPIEKVQIPKYNVSVLRLRSSNRVSGSRGSTHLPNSNTQHRKTSSETGISNMLIPPSSERTSIISQMLRKISISSKPTTPLEPNKKKSLQDQSLSLGDLNHSSSDDAISIASNGIFEEEEEEEEEDLELAVEPAGHRTRRMSLSAPDLSVKNINLSLEFSPRNESVTGPITDPSLNGFNALSSSDHVLSQGSDIVIGPTISEEDEKDL